MDKMLVSVAARHRATVLRQSQRDTHVSSYDSAKSIVGRGFAIPLCSGMGELLQQSRLIWPIFCSMQVLCSNCRLSFSIVSVYHRNS